MAVAQRSFQAGELQHAEEAYRDILRQHPTNANALQMLGLVLYQSGKRLEAVEAIQHALAIRPDADGFYNLGVMFSEQRRYLDAVGCYRDSLRHRPNDVDTYNNLGNALKDLGELNEAAECYQKAIRIKPDTALANFNLGSLYHQQKQLTDAETCYRNVLRHHPEHIEALLNLGTTLKDQGKLDEAMTAYRQVLEIRPEFVSAYVNLANVCLAVGNSEEAVKIYQRGLAIEPDHLDALNNLGGAYRSIGRASESVSVYERALLAHPRSAKLHNNLGNAHASLGSPESALESYRRALGLDPEYAAAHSNMLLTSHYLPEITQERLAQQHAEWEATHARKLRSKWKPFLNDRDPTRRLRLGFVSSDLARHPVGSFFVLFIESLEFEQFETVCYSGRIVKDELTSRIEAASDIWRDVHHLSNDELAQSIRADSVDILFDLGGHTAGDRLLAFARKPAPIQIAWIGYPSTTGLAAMDYLIADRVQVPEEHEDFYAEEVVRLPAAHFCYDPPQGAPDVSPLPSLANGYVTFASFNNPLKLTDRVVEVWSEILERVPTAKLILKYRGLDEPEVRQRFLERFGKCGTAAERLELLGWTPYAQMMQEYDQVDVALDPFPFSGGATSCEALWMGVPVITCAGNTFASRQTLSYLSHIGVTETAADSLDEYIELAVALAGDFGRLGEMRAGLRETMAASPLCDARRFTASMTGSLRDIWRQWCDSSSG